MRLCIDCGHGMGNRTPGVYDPGAGKDPTEAQVVREVGPVLAAGMRDVADVLLINDGYVFLRDDRAWRWRATHYLGLHCDGSTNQNATGTSVWINRGDPSGVRAQAAKLGKAVADALDINWRGVSEKDFAVLTGRQPDMLLEMFFVTNPADVRAYHANRVAMQTAIIRFLREWGGVEEKEDSVLLVNLKRVANSARIEQYFAAAGFESWLVDAHDPQPVLVVFAPPSQDAAAARFLRMYDLRAYRITGDKVTKIT